MIPRRESISVAGKGRVARTRRGPRPRWSNAPRPEADIRIPPLVTIAAEVQERRREDRPRLKINVAMSRMGDARPLTLTICLHLLFETTLIIFRKSCAHANIGHWAQKRISMIHSSQFAAFEYRETVDNHHNSNMREDGDVRVLPGDQG